MISQQITHRSLINFNDQIGHLYVPNLCMRQPYSEKPYFILTNSQGFRSDFDFEKSSKNGEKRIAFIGDSFTAGDGVENKMRFSDLVSNTFEAKSYNFGLSGSGVDQQAIIYKNIATQYQHDILVLSPHISDISRNLLQERISTEGQTGRNIYVPKPYFTVENDKLVRHNKIISKERKVVEGKKEQGRLFKPSDSLRAFFHKYMPKKIKEKLLKLQFSEQHAGYSSESDPRWVLMKKLLEDIIESAGDKPIILAPLPYHRVSMNPEYRERFRNLAKNYKNVFFVDVLEKFKTVPDSESLYFAKDSHYSEFGHRVIAEVIEDEIKKQGFLKVVQSKVNIEKKQTDSTYILGISAFYHDSACAIIKDGEIIAAASEERFSRIKNDSRFPSRAVNFCLEEAKINMDNVEAVVFYDHPYLTLERIISSQISAFPLGSQIWTELFPKWVQTKMHIPDIISSELGWQGKIHLVKHHLSHAASAFYMSPYTKSAILTIDGVGEWATSTIGVGNGNDIKILKEMNYPNSVGLLYSAFTYYTGFKVNEGEYKLMGLAPYGNPTYVDLIKDHIVKIHEDGSITLNMDYFGFKDKLSMINEKFEDLFGGPARDSSENIDQRIRDIAKSIQVVTEEIIIKMAKNAKKITGSDYLCLAGGVALNCVANGKLLRENIFKDVWIQPAAGDSGGAVGAALALFYEKYNKNNFKRKEGVVLQKGSYWGPSFSNNEIKAYIDSFDYQYSELKPDERNKVIAKYLADGKLVGHFSGKMEFGPRALGARSILGDPRSESAQSTLNLKIKFRESFRPFAPSVLEENVSDYFDQDRPSPYMLIVADVNKDRCIKRDETDENDLFKIVNQKRSDLPAITHVDYSARVQTVSDENHPVYYDLIKEFKNLTGVGVVINTSFNVNGEPIICTPKDAVTCFMTTNMDVLVMNNFILLKEEQKERDLDQLKFIRPKNKHSNLDKTTKAKTDANKIFNEYFQKFSEYKGSLKSFETNKNSQWFEASKYYIDIIDPKKAIQAEEILKHWITIPENKRKEFIPFLNEIIDLSSKYKIEPSEIENSEYDSIYVMF